MGSAQTDVTQQVMEVEGREKTSKVKEVLNQIGEVQCLQSIFNFIQLVIVN